MSGLLVAGLLVGCQGGGDDNEESTAAGGSAPVGLAGGPAEGADAAGAPADPGRQPKASLDPRERPVPPDDIPTPAPPGATSTTTDPVSTIALDVDTASYGYARRSLAGGSRPSPATVRPEEFVNALGQHYPEPSGDGFAISVDGARTPVRTGGTASHVVRVGLQTRARSDADRPDAALTFVIDVSGSMAEPGKLDLVKDALHTLVSRLRSSDRVAIVTFSEEAKVVSTMTPVSDKDKLDKAIESLSPVGGTNFDQGVQLGYKTARKGFRAGASNRVVVLSDGLANIGDTSADPILRKIKDEAGKGIALLTVGVGADYGDAVMERLADAGDGFAVYVSEPAQARKVFVEDLPATIEVRALDAKAQVRFDPKVVTSYRLIGYDNRAVRDTDFKDDKVDGGEVGPGHTVTALYDVTLAEGARGPLGTVAVHWVDPGDRKPQDLERTLNVSDVDKAEGTPWLRASVVAARLAEGLKYGQGDLPGTAAEAARVAGVLSDPTVRDLADTARKAAALR